MLTQLCLFLRIICNLEKGNGCQNLENINFSTNPYHGSIRSSIWNVSNSFILLCWASFIQIETFLSNGWPWHLCCQNKTGQLKTFALRTFIANIQNETSYFTHKDLWKMCTQRIARNFKFPSWLISMNLKFTWFYSLGSLRPLKKLSVWGGI